MSFSLENEKTKIIVRWIIIAICTVIFIFFMYQITTFFNLRNDLNSQIEKEKDNYIELSNRIDSVEVLIEKIKTDSLFVEKLARENLGMIKKGEKVFKFKKLEKNESSDR